MTDAIDRLVEPEQLKIILTIANTNSISRAATALGVSQPSISQQLKRLETLAGRPLFRRTRTGVVLTEDGEAVVIYARAMLALTEDLKRHLARLAGSIQISIGMSEDFSRTALPAVLWFFMRAHPQVDIRIISGTYDTLISAVESSAVDLAVMRRHSRLSDATLLWTDKLVWIGREDVTLPIQDPVPLALPVAPNVTRDTVTGILSSSGRSWRILFESTSLACLEAALQAGFGVCGGPFRMRLYGVTALDERCGLPKLPDVEFVMARPRQPESDAVRAFAAVLHQAAASSFNRPDTGGLDHGCR